MATTKTIGTSQDYSTVAGWESALDSLGKDYHYGEMTDEDFNEQLTFDISWIPDTDNRIVLRSQSGSSFDGTAQSGARIYYAASTFQFAITIQEDWFEFGSIGRGIELECTGAGGAVTHGNSDVVYESLLIHGASTRQSGIILGTNCVAKNCISEGWEEGILFVNNQNGLAVNCTVANCDDYGYRYAAGNAARIINCIAFNGSINWSGTYHADSGHNGGESGDSPPGSNNVTTVVSGDFVDDQAGGNYKLAASASVLGDGAGPSDGTRGSYVPTTDIDGTTRSGATCDIGADEYEAAGAALLKKAGSTLAISEGAKRNMAMKRFVAGSLDLTEEVRRMFSFLRFVAEPMALSEAVGRQMAMRRIVDETLIINESVLNQISRALKKFISETMVISETLLHKMALKRIVSETLGLSETVRRLRMLTRFISETQSIAETVGHQITGTLIKIINETISISESVARQLAGSLNKFINEVLILGESAVRRSALIRVVAEALDISETVLRKINFKRFVRETLGVAEAAAGRRTMKRIISETLGLSENARWRRSLKKIINESLAITEFVASNVAAALTVIIEGTRRIFTIDTMRRVFKIDTLRRIFRRK